MGLMSGRYYGENWQPDRCAQAMGVFVEVAPVPESELWKKVQLVRIAIKILVTKVVLKVVTKTPRSNGDSDINC